jgi:hypothetical protein
LAYPCMPGWEPLGGATTYSLPSGASQLGQPPGRHRGWPQWQVQRFSGGTLARAWPTCWPQPVQVILPQRLQTAGLHIRGAPKIVEMTPEQYHRGYSWHGLIVLSDVWHSRSGQRQAQRVVALTCLPPKIPNACRCPAPVPLARWWRASCATGCGPPTPASTLATSCPTTRILPPGTRASTARLSTAPACARTRSSCRPALTRHAPSGPARPSFPTF